MRRGFLVLAGLASLVGGCSIVPDMPSFSSGGPPVTNDAVDACKRKARDEGYSNVGQQQVMPAGDGRYLVTLQAEGDDGYAARTCVFDPATGAQLRKGGQ
jgi:hypothetical protein